MEISDKWSLIKWCFSVPGKSESDINVFDMGRKNHMCKQKHMDIVVM